MIDRINPEINPCSSTLGLLLANSALWRNFSLATKPAHSHKTGTTSSERDVWFVGYVPQLATAVWVGNDNYQSMGKGITGGDFAAPVWRSFMLKALKDEPVKYFPAASKFSRP